MQLFDHMDDVLKWPFLRITASLQGELSCGGIKGSSGIYMRLKTPLNAEFQIGTNPVPELVPNRVERRFSPRCPRLSSTA